MTDKAQLEKSFINPRVDIFSALKAINSGGSQIALIIDKNKKLIGVLTDGDIRRSLLQGLSLNDSIENLYNKNFFKISEAHNRSTAKNIMLLNGLNALPVVDDDGVPIDIVVLSEFGGSDKLDNPVVIMAGGKGSRLRPYTERCPKPMLPLHGKKPILQAIIEQVRSNGFRNIFLSVNYLKEQIMDYFGDGKEFGVNIQYLIENEPLGTAGSLSLISFKEDLPVIVMNGDVITNFNLNDLLKFHVENFSDATLAVSEYETKIPFGIVKSNGSELISFEEKPIISHLINAGLYVLNKKIIEQLILKNQRSDMPEILLQAKERNFKVSICPIFEYWIDIGRPETLKKAQTKANDAL